MSILGTTIVSNPNLIAMFGQTNQLKIVSIPNLEICQNSNLFTFQGPQRSNKIVSDLDRHIHQGKS